MKIQRVYIDTSVIGGCFDAEFELWSNGLMEDFRTGKLKAVVSDVIAAEVKDAPAAVQALFIELLALSPDQIHADDAAFELADAYQQRGILTPKYYDDGLHIALATISEVDVLVSWNFKHIVHFDKIRLFNAANLEFGYKPLQIYSPREVATYGETND
jgi:hypothetical protein